jgi:hypothetical protein
MLGRTAEAAISDSNEQIDVTALTRINKRLRVTAPPDLNGQSPTTGGMSRSILGLSESARAMRMLEAAIKPLR